ncbi:MAG: hypothetical protein GQ532_05000 [Methylomarinum sp.]|nr:hypothetical protein [Methylomarinum sp.]
MIIFLADGRLGNQLFQYAFLKAIQRRKEKIMVSGFEELNEVFEVNDIIRINKKNRWIRVIVFRMIRPVLIFLSDYKIISAIKIVHEKILDNFRRETKKTIKTNGLFDVVLFVKLGFFQSNVFFEENDIKHLEIKKKYKDCARQNIKSIPLDSHRVFVHIRRGDYKDHKVYGRNTLLPIEYYKEQINWFKLNKKNPFFIFLSDEPDFIEEEFGYIKEKIIPINNHFGVDMAIMSLCQSAILSPSSFSWWGSYFMKKRDTVFTPEYWLGFESKTEYQKGTITEYMTEIDIK